jgi:hypothetical protein
LGEHDELDRLTDACAMWRAIIDQADELAPDIGGGMDPEAEMRLRLPAVIGTCTPATRQAIREHVSLVADAVALLHRTRRRLEEHAMHTGAFVLLAGVQALRLLA